MSGCYASRSREFSARSIEDARLLGKIRAFHVASRGTYGVRRIHAGLVADGEKVARPRAAPDAFCGLGRLQSAQVDGYDDA